MEVEMDGQFVDDLAQDLAHAASRRVLLARVAAIGIGGLLAAAGVPRSAAAKRKRAAKRKPAAPPKPVGATRKAVGAHCQDHHQCASYLCEVTSGTCVAQCTSDEECGAGCLCQPIGGAFPGKACLQMPEDLNCSSFPTCTWGDDDADPFDAVSCPDQPGMICDVTGTCYGHEETCLLLCPPSRRG
jgi:hypothetical protein